MAAMRSALAMLGRRSCALGSSAASSMGGRGLEIHRVPRPAAPPLRPAALEGWRRYSTEGREPTKEAEGVLRMWWQRWYTTGLNSEEAYTRGIVFQMVLMGTVVSYYVASMAAIARM
ncbi:unnamed protein product [Urochloa decumbens]|uniref:Uncharacterized protein n=1 Tax=Urochloa decumbens TaxID=240449 RepID=A0ABC8ZCV3_9POAL